MFEILNKINNYPSGYYFYVNPYYRRYGLRAYKPQWDKGTRFNFVIKRWRGPVVGIRTYGSHSDWLSFKDERNSDGSVKAYKNQVYYFSDFPSMDKTFTLEAGMCKMFSNDSVSSDVQSTKNRESYQLKLILILDHDILL